MRLRGHAPGFTLIELSVVLVVIALLLGSMLVPLATQIDQRNVAQTRQLLEDAREAIIGFAMINGRLPRPATSVSDGTERATTCGSQAQPKAACTGFIPWAALGLPRTDAWGKQLRYSVSPNFADSPFNFTTSTAGHKKVCPDSACATPVVSGVPAVILSHGPNNWGYRDDGTQFGDLSSTNTDEDLNDAKFKCTVDADCDDFISRTISKNTGGAGGEFDDLVAWIPNTVLFNRMVTAGRLP